jgi:hypothetical protein
MFSTLIGAHRKTDIGKVTIAGNLFLPRSSVYLSGRLFVFSISLRDHRQTSAGKSQSMKLVDSSFFGLVQWPAVYVLNLDRRPQKN